VARSARAWVLENGVQPLLQLGRPRRLDADNRRRLDRALYGQRYLVELFFHNLKRTRYEKTASSFLALVHLVCACMWLS
jgi:transposase